MFTVTVIVEVALPFGPVTVSVYVVVAEGEMTLEPVVGTGPMPGLIEAVVAFVEDQYKVADCPSEMELGEALRVAVGGCRSASQTKLRFESYTCKVRPVAPPG